MPAESAYLQKYDKEERHYRASSIRYDSNPQNAEDRRVIREVWQTATKQLSERERDRERSRAETVRKRQYARARRRQKMPYHQTTLER